MDGECLHPQLRGAAHDRRLFVVGLGLFVAVSAACGLAPNVGALIAARHAGVRRGAGDATGRDATERGVQV